MSQQDVERVLAKPRSETGGLDSDIFLKHTARVELTSNIDIADRLINGQLGTVVRVDINQTQQKPSTVYVNNNAGKHLIETNSNSFDRENKVVPIKPVLVKIKIRPNKPSSPEIQKTHFLLTIVYAVSIPNVQGLFLTNLVVSLELVKQKAFNYGQIYALCRATS